MRIGIVYTVITQELVADIEREIRSQLGSGVELLGFENPEILQIIRDNGRVTPQAASMFLSLYAEALRKGASAVFSACSSVGELTDSLQDFARFTGVPFVRIDEEMCREAVRRGRTIAVMATLPTTMEPTTNTLHRVAREMGKPVQLVEVLVDNAFGLSQDQFKERMTSSALAHTGDCDVILFAQGSMAYCEEHIHNLTGKLVLSSPAFGAKALRAALVAKGALSGL